MGRASALPQVLHCRNIYYGQDANGRSTVYPLYPSRNVPAPLNSRTQSLGHDKQLVP